jgi:hypothetical protein
MVAARRIIAISVDADQHRTLVEISRSRTEPANRVERAGIILAYLDEPSAYAVARAIGVSQQTVTLSLLPCDNPPILIINNARQAVEMARAAGSRARRAPHSQLGRCHRRAPDQRTH